MLGLAKKADFGYNAITRASLLIDIARRGLAKMPKQSGARAMLVLAAALNLIPLAYTGLVIAPGTASGGSNDARLRFIAAHQVAWSTGWLMWMAASVGLVLSVWVLARVAQERTRAPELIRFAPLVVTIGSAVDLVGDGIQAAVLPALADRYASAATNDATHSTVLVIFQAADRLATTLSAETANTLYFIAGVLVVIALATVPNFPKWLTVLGGVAWLVTLAATPAALVPTLLPVAVAGALFLYAAWLIALALWGIGDGKPRLPLPHFHRV